MKKLLAFILLVFWGGYYVKSEFYSTKNESISVQARTEEQVMQSESIMELKQRNQYSTIAMGDSARLAESNEIPQKALDELHSEQFALNSLVNGAGYSEAGAKAFMERRSVAIDDGPKSLREMLKRDLEDLKRNGYAEVEEDVASQIIDMEKNLIGKAAEPIKNINFRPSNIPEKLLSEYQYIGYGFDPSGENKNSGVPSDSLQRLYKNDSSSIVLDESPFNEDFHSSLTTEFINASVGGHDAIYEVKRTPSGRTYTMLNWSDGKRIYSLNEFGNSVDKTRLIEIANDLNTLNNK